ELEASIHKNCVDSMGLPDLLIRIHPDESWTTMQDDPEEIPDPGFGDRGGVNV
ncbi:Hypothetical protein FKW44_019599, partial [Caligus rogercresseyi]